MKHIAPRPDPLAVLRDQIRVYHTMPEAEMVAGLVARQPLSASGRAAAAAHAAALVERLRDRSRPGLMEVFLAEYGLSTDEGIALMCLAEALLRVPDADTVDALIEDKIAPSEWSAHLGRSTSPLVNASTWALMLTGRVLRDGEGEGVVQTLRGAVKRLGEPVIRTAVRQAMREMGRQFVLGENIDAAMDRARAEEARGYTYSYDMLGEAAMTAADAHGFFEAYGQAIERIGRTANADDILAGPGISIKLSALHPRYDVQNHIRVMTELVPRVTDLVRAARDAGISVSIDAEEADRLDLSLDVVEAVARHPAIVGWDGFGVVVQAYSRRALPVIDWVAALAKDTGSRMPVRLVKGAYWDAEIKRAQVEGLVDFPVFTRKAATDVSYITCAARLLKAAPHVYPQFATHNAHTVTAILQLTGEGRDHFEFQRLHGMGEALHDAVLADERTRCRIYAPVGAHRDLLAYLVRRLLENGANSSFVNQVLDRDVPAAKVAADPFAVAVAVADLGQAHGMVSAPADLFMPERPNSRGYDLHDPVTLANLDRARAPFRTALWSAGPILAGRKADGASHRAANPADPSEPLGDVTFATPADVAHALDTAAPWTAPVIDRARILNAAATLYEKNAPEIFALLAREAGKTLPDAVAELREAVDFLRYYAAQAVDDGDSPLGSVACISPWNFPLAIFTGQIAAALAAGNAVLAKPAETTSLIATRAVALLHQAGVPRTALQLLPGRGAETGAALTSDPRVHGVVFTGSTATARAINHTMAAHLAPDAPLIAETGGLNAMVVDSTALPEQAVRDIIASAFQSAGQRCSALRCLYLQSDIAADVLRMLKGAMDELALGDPWSIATDIGPVIDATARDAITAHVEAARKQGRLLHQDAAPKDGTFIAPALIQVAGIGDLDREVFGPVLHVATFEADRIADVVADVNATGYGLTFGLHTRIDARVDEVARAVVAGNIYVNRNQIGAVVGSQPFGGTGLSGTGPKAGGPLYLSRFRRMAWTRAVAQPQRGPLVDARTLSTRLSALRVETRLHVAMDLPSPTGEMNRYKTRPRGRILCLGPDAEAAQTQAKQARAAGCGALCIAPGITAAEGLDGRIDPAALKDLDPLDAVAYRSTGPEARAIRQALASRPGPIVPLLTQANITADCRTEQHLCIDTTASGGNATLLANAG